MRALDVVRGTVRRHRDGRGFSIDWPCGCSEIHRGETMRRRFCNPHGLTWPNATPDSDPAHPRPPAARRTPNPGETTHGE